MESFAWMRLGDALPVKVPADSEEISLKMWQGYVQCDPPEVAREEIQKKVGG